MSTTDGGSGYEPAEDDGVLEPSDSLETDDQSDDPLGTGIGTADGYAAAESFGTTAAEAARGESLDQLLAEEEPDVPPVEVDDRWDGGPGPRVGHLTHPFEENSTILALDEGAGGGTGSAEETAVHLTDEDADADLFDEDEEAYGDQDMAGTDW